MYNDHNQRRKADVHNADLGNDKKELHPFHTAPDTPPELLNEAKPADFPPRRTSYCFAIPNYANAPRNCSYWACI